MEYQEIARTVTCKRCGATDAAWMQSKRTGRHYLVQTHVVDGKLVASPREFHDCQKHHDAQQYAPLAPMPTATQVTEALAQPMLDKAKIKSQIKRLQESVERLERFTDAAYNATAVREELVFAGQVIHGLSVLTEGETK